jgi:hypothetical protein
VLLDNHLGLASVKVMVRNLVVDLCGAEVVDAVAAEVHPTVVVVAAVAVVDFVVAVNNKKHSILVSTFCFSLYVCVCVCIYQYSEQQQTENGFVSFVFYQYL